jgi:ABC-type glycerol-3-phosphate transport system substrate-binding protein
MRPSAGPGAAGRRRRRGARRAGLRLVVATVLLAACAPDRRIPLVIYSPHGRDLLTLLAGRFEQLHPDVAVHWLDMGSQEVYDRLRSERANPAADVWFGGPATIFARGARPATSTSPCTKRRR